MKKFGKKGLCILLSVFLLLSSIPLLSISSYAEIFGIKDNLTEFSEDVTALIRNAENSVNVMNFYSASTEETEMETADAEFETARLIVKSKGKIDVLNAVDVADGYNDLHILQFATSLDAQKACEYYLTLDNVEYAHPDRVVQASEMEGSDKTIEEIIAENPKLEEPTIQVGIKALNEYLTSQNIVYTDEIDVAVIDTGVESTHELLKDRVEPTGKNFSDDGDADSSEDNEGHGTHVAGILVVNSLSNVTIKPYKVLNSKGSGTELQVTLGIESAIADGVDVINMSLGGRSYSEIMHEAVKKAYNQGITVVVASGNEFTNIDKVTYSPASFPECITVTAHGSNCSGNPGANYGKLCDIAAPGVNIRSSYLDNSYATLSGTSMATPIVAAAVTYVLLENPGMKPDDVTALLQKYAVPEAYSSSSGRMCLYMEFTTRDVMELSEPIFSVEGGDFEETFELTLSSVDEGVTIYYNKSEFSPTYFKVYSEPITIKYNTTVKAYAYRKGTVASEIVVNDYTRIFPDEDSKYIMDEDGTIVEYLGEDTELIVPDIIQGIEVTAVGSKAFYENETLEYVVLPDKVTTIGSQAFSSSQNLVYVRALGVLTVGDAAFSNCKALENFETANLKTINHSSFSYCSSLQYIDFSKVTSIGSCAFSEATGVPSLVSEALTIINTQAFKESDIKVVDVPNATKIDQWAFNGCKSLEKVNIPSVTEIGNSAFVGCSALPEIKADNLAKVGSFAFAGCTSLEEIDFPELWYLGSYAGATFDVGVFKNCTGIKTVNLPKVTAVTRQSFTGCTALETISMPQVTSIDSYSFMDCTSLKEVNFPNATELNVNVFKGCTNLKEIEFPSATTVSRDAFSDECYLERVILPSVETVYDLPTGAKVAIGSTATFMEEVDETTCAGDVTIYGTRKTYANEWANENKVEFVNISQETALFKDVPLDFAKAESEVLEVDAIGFNRTYQWYSNTVEDNLTGTPIEGAIGKTLDTSAYNEAPYYYCVILSTDANCDPVEIRTGYTILPCILESMSSQIRFGKKEDGSYAGTFDIRTRAKISDEYFKEYVGATNAEAIERIDKVGFVYTQYDIYEFDEIDARAVAMGETVAGYTDAPVSYIQDADGYYVFTCVITGLMEGKNEDESLRAYAYICVDGVWYFFAEAHDTKRFYNMMRKYYPYAAEAYGWPDWSNRIY